MVIGVTGGIGAGKSTVLNILKNEYDAKLIMTDDVAKELMEPGRISYEKIVQNFGSEVLNEDGTLDNKRIASIVFADEEKLALLNSLTHPYVKDETRNRIDRYESEEQDPLVVVEAALLIEAGFLDILDELWIVMADKETRINRLMESRGYSREKCESIISNQLSDEEFASYADFIIDNSGSLEQTVEMIGERLRSERDKSLI